MPVLQLRSVNKHYHQTQALFDVSFSIPQGKVVGFVGANGAGKTTTIKSILDFHSITSGEILLFNRPHTDKEARRKLGFLPERPYFYDGLTGPEFLEFYGRLSGLKRNQVKVRVAALLRRVGLEHVGKKLLRDYSKGMTQRLGLAQALIHEPEFLILDEPVSGLDPMGRMDVQKILLELKSQGKTIFFSSHILPDVEAVCDDVIVIHKGKVVSTTTGEQLLRSAVKYYDWTVEGVSQEALARAFPRARFVGENGTAVMLHLESAPDPETHRQIHALGGSVVAVTPMRERLEDLLFQLARQDAVSGVHGGAHA